MNTSKGERMARRYEVVARLFKLSTGFIAPGCSVPSDLMSEQYERDRIQAWNHWTDADKATAAINTILFLEERWEDYEKLFNALELCDTNQIRQERDALRLRIKAVDEEHVQLAAERKKMIEAYTSLEKQMAALREAAIFAATIGECTTVGCTAGEQKDLGLRWRSTNDWARDVAKQLHAALARAEREEG